MRADLRRLEGFLEPARGAGQQEAGEVERPAAAAWRAAFPAEICKRTSPHRAAEKAEDAVGLGPGNSAVSRSQAAASASLTAREARQSFVPASVEMPSQVPSGKALAKGRARGRRRAAARQFRRHGAWKAASREERQVHRRPVVAEAGKRVGAGLDRAARFRGLFEDPDPPAARRKMQRRRQGALWPAPIRTASGFPTIARLLST
jgi:hypothetical protein